MDFLLLDPDVERLPPEKTRILNLRAEPYPDGRRLRLGLELTPFQQRPSIELSLADSSGELSASASIVEPTSWKLELTMHVRKSQSPTEEYVLSACLSYPKLGEVDRRELTLNLPSAAG